MGNVNDIPAPYNVGPACLKCMGLGDLQTPFTWFSPVLAFDDCEMVQDKISLLGTPWAKLVNRLQIAFGFFCNGNRGRGRAQLVECYLPLLPLGDVVCGIIDEHREALRHVLDASWAAMDRVEALQQLGGMFGGRHHHDEDPVFKACVRSITPFSRLSRKQQAAVCAIQGALSSDPDLLRKAVSLNPAEGEWHHKLGCLLEERRGAAGMMGQVLPTAEELTALRTAYRLRPGPDATTRLARSLVHTGPKGCSEANKLVREALSKFPDSPRVLFITACMAGPLRQCNDTQASSVALKLFERCDELLGGRCVSVLLKLYVVCKNLGRDRDAKAYMDRASAINKAVLQSHVDENASGMSPEMEKRFRGRM